MTDYSEGSEPTLTKEQAIAAMKEGKKVRHRFLMPEEWVSMKDGQIIFEDGFSCTPQDFWYDRNIQDWQTDWSIVEGSKPIKLTDEQRRIEKEANKFASFETAPTEFEKYHDLYTGYIAGANAERERLQHESDYTDEYTQLLTEHRDKLAEKLSALEMADNIMLKDLRDQLTQRDETIKKLKEALREVIPIADYGYTLLVPFDKKRMVVRWFESIQKARNFIVD